MSLFYAILGLAALFLCITLYHYTESIKLDFIDPNNPEAEELQQAYEYSMITKEELWFIKMTYQDQNVNVLLQEIDALMNRIA